MNTLHAYQKEGVEFLKLKTRAYISDEMGLGKTPQAIVAAKELGIHPAHALVVCPAIARVNWQREWLGWYSPGSPAPNILSYEQATKSPYAPHRPARLIIFDEAHYLKNPTAQRTKAALSRGGYGERAERVWFLSGTPAPNHPGELWSILDFCGQAGMTYDEWVSQYCVAYRVGYQLRITGMKKSAADTLKWYLASTGLFLRRRKAEVLKDLPPIWYQHTTVEPPANFNQIGMQQPRDITLVEQERKLLEGVLESQGADAMLALANGVSTLRRYTGFRKATVVSKMIAEEAANGAWEKLVVFAVHTAVIEKLVGDLGAFGAVAIQGKHSPKQRQAAIDSFSDPKSKCRVIVCQVQAAGTAITLHARGACSNVLVVECPWTPGELAQACARVHRIGQPNGVTVRIVSLLDSIDQAVSGLVARKAEEIGVFVDGEAVPEKWSRGADKGTTGSAEDEFAPPDDGYDLIW